MKTHTKLSLVLSTLILSASIASNAVADGAALYQAKGCLSCHGADAKTPVAPGFPRIAGQNPDYSFNQMRDIKSGARSNGQSVAMKGIMIAVSEAEIRELADWLGTQ
jgi:cytochrome c